MINMPTIALRAYLEEINALLQMDAPAGAVAHCRQILKAFPKTVAVYRLLGNALYSAGDFNRARDVYERFLSAIPEDALAHKRIGAILALRGSLDQALWHTQRAFELQPGNRQLRTQLQELHNRRSGTAPTPVHLTRSALARIYLHNQYYSETINEARAALTQDPGRSDLLLVLAEALLNTGKLIEAANACNLVLRRLPYCFSANLIVWRIVAQESRREEAEGYRHRLCDLDPYFIYVEHPKMHPEEAPAELVLVERLVIPQEHSAPDIWLPEDELSSMEHQPSSSLPVTEPDVSQAKPPEPWQGELSTSGGSEEPTIPESEKPGVRLSDNSWQYEDDTPPPSETHSSD